MAIIVKKFGGSSVATIDLIKSIAHKIAESKRPDDSLVLVVSAMAKTTDELFRLAFDVSDHPSRRELDMLLTAGERISMSLLSLALHNEGFSSISFTGSQSGIKTDAMHGNARITDVNAFRIHDELALGKIVIVAGFQGVSPAKEITTLGRGGSDTSAVALASYLKADLCEIYTDVDGVYTADPRLVPGARLIKKLDYAQMLALAYCGSKVLHPRAVEFAYKYNIPVEVKSSFTFSDGTLLGLGAEGTTDKIMENKTVTALAHKDGLVRYVIRIDSALTSALQEWNNEIFRYYLDKGEMELMIESKFVPEIDHLIHNKGLHLIAKHEGWAYISMVGLGINLDPGLLSRTMEILSNSGYLRISHSEKTIDVLLPSSSLQTSLTLLHREFIELPLRETCSKED